MSLNAITYAGMMRLLMDGEYTMHRIAQETGLHTATTSRYLTALHKRRVLYICDWVQNPVNKNWHPVFTMNPDNQADVAKPAPKTKAEVDREYHIRLRSKALLHRMAGKLEAA